MTEPKPVTPNEIKYTKLFINNEFVDAISGATHPVINPTTEEKIIDVQAADAEDVDKAVNAAKAAFHRRSIWRSMDAKQRGELLYKVSLLVEKNCEYLSRLEATNNGVLYVVAQYMMKNVITILRYYSGWADKIQGKTIPASGEKFTYTRHEPVGVVGCIVPWNVPLGSAVIKISTALSAGCTVVVKPSEMTPLTLLFFCSLLKEAGVPSGVVNVVPGLGDKAGDAISRHPDIRKIAFTGSTRVGKLLAANGALTLKHLSLELGGKSPLIVCEDVDLEKAARDSVDACYRLNGQACLNATRTYVHESIYDQFVKKCVAFAQSFVVGDNFDSKTQIGPLVSRVQMDRVLSYINKGIQEGAKLECGGKRWGSKGYFVEPTVFSNVTEDMVIAREEIFGPVMSILKWNDFEEVLDRANDNNYGLQAGIFTQSLDKSMLFAQAIEAGHVSVNMYSGLTVEAPFGGMKESGIGREYGEYGVMEYTEVKNVVIKLPYKQS